MGGYIRYDCGLGTMERAIIERSQTCSNAQADPQGAFFSAFSSMNRLAS